MIGSDIKLFNVLGLECFLFICVGVCKGNFHLEMKQSLTSNVQIYKCSC